MKRRLVAAYRQEEEALHEARVVFMNLDSFYDLEFGARGPAVKRGREGDWCLEASGQSGVEARVEVGMSSILPHHDTVSHQVKRLSLGVKGEVKQARQVFYRNMD